MTIVQIYRWPELVLQLPSTQQGSCIIVSPALVESRAVAMSVSRRVRSDLAVQAVFDRGIHGKPLFLSERITFTAASDRMGAG